MRKFSFCLLLTFGVLLIGGETIRKAEQQKQQQQDPVQCFISCDAEYPSSHALFTACMYGCCGSCEM